MLAHVLTTLPFLVVQACLGGATGYLLGGAAPAMIVATVALVASVATAAVTGRALQQAAYRQSVLAAILTALHLAALYTIGDDGTTLLPGANTQLLVATLGFIACAWFATRLRRGAVMSSTHDRRTVPVDDDDDRTIELDPPPQGASSLETLPTPRLRSPVALGFVSTALFVVATLFWMGGDGKHDGIGGNAVARELPTPSPSSNDDGVVAAADEAAAPTISNAGGDAGVELPAPDASDRASPGKNAVAPSAARRECMAQIESAHLFRQIAQQSPGESQYSLATQGHIARMLKSRPVGPRTLGRIAERMWELRDAPERDAAWWASQFSRCEAARSGGSWYVVKG